MGHGRLPEPYGSLKIMLIHWPKKNNNTQGGFELLPESDSLAGLHLPHPHVARRTFQKSIGECFKNGDP